MGFESRRNIPVLFQIIRYAAAVLALWMVFSGCHQALAEPVLGASIAMFGVLILVGVIRMKVFSFQIAALLYFLMASAVFMAAWMPSPESSFVMNRGIAVLFIVLLLALATGSVSLARHLSLGYVLRRKEMDHDERSG